MATELSLIGRVDTKVRNKALLAPWGCRAFEQVSAMLLAGCPGKKRCEKRCEDAADAELAKSDVIQTGHICFFQLAVCFWVLGLPLFFKFCVYIYICIHTYIYIYVYVFFGYR